ncbi:MAG: hypothetical protein AAGE59_21645, partial [Cyanobacteria bacterium P01_F01_bin.86]
MAVIRTGLITFDVYDILDISRLKRDILMVDKIAVDFKQLDGVKRYLSAICTGTDIDCLKILQKFDKNLENLHEIGLLKEVSLSQTKLSDEIQSEVDLIL